MRTSFAVVLAVAVTSMTLPEQSFAQVTVEAEMAAQIVDKMPQDPSTSFAVDVGVVYCWTRVTGGADTELQHIWIHDEMEFPVTLEIGGSPWRTWTSKTIPPEWAGEWRVEVRDGAGVLLDTRSFTVGASDS